MNLTSGELIALWRSRKGLKQKDLGAICYPDLSAPHVKVRKLEAGMQKPKMADLRLIAEALKIPVENLLPGGLESEGAGGEGVLVRPEVLTFFPKLKDYLSAINSAVLAEDKELILSAVNLTCKYLQNTPINPDPVDSKSEEL